MSMHTIGRWHCHSSSEPTSDGDDENVGPMSRLQKHRKTGKDTESSTLNFEEMKEIMRMGEKHCAAFEGKIVQALEDSTKVYEKTQDKFINVLMDKLN
jgi:hypothetical protein